MGHPPMVAVEEYGEGLTIMVKLCLIPVMKSVAFEATGTKPDLMPGASGVVRLGDEMPMGTHGAANEDCVTV